MTEEYPEIDSADLLSAWSTTHQNDDETHVVALDVGETSLAMAVDVDGAGDVLESELIASTVTDDEAVERARRWIDDNPKGIQGDGPLASLLG